MICGRCHQDKPRSAFWSVELGRHHLKCGECRHDEANAKWKREAATVKHIEAVRNVSARDHRMDFWPYPKSGSNVQLTDQRSADLLAWTFLNNPQLGARPPKGDLGV